MGHWRNSEENLNFLANENTTYPNTMECKYGCYKRKGNDCEYLPYKFRAFSNNLMLWLKVLENNKNQNKKQ